MDIEINSEESCEIAEFYGEQVILARQKLKDIEIYKKCNLDILQKCAKIYLFLVNENSNLGNIEKQELIKLSKIYLITKNKLYLIVN